MTFEEGVAESEDAWEETVGELDCSDVVEIGRLLRPEDFDSENEKPELLNVRLE